MLFGECPKDAMVAQSFVQVAAASACGMVGSESQKGATRATVHAPRTGANAWRTVKKLRREQTAPMLNKVMDSVLAADAPQGSATSLEQQQSDRAPNQANSTAAKKWSRFRAQRSKSGALHLMQQELTAVKTNR